MGQIQSGLRSAVRIAQGSHIKIHMTREIPVQVFFVLDLVDCTTSPVFLRIFMCVSMLILG